MGYAQAPRIGIQQRDAQTLPAVSLCRSLAWKLVSPLITKKVRERMVVFGRGVSAAERVPALAAFP